MNNKFSRPRIVISKCLNFDNCRFNGEKIKDSYLEKLGEYVDFVPVCPEVAIGLGIPRLPLRLFKQNNDLRLYQPSSDTDFTQKMSEFGQKFLQKQNFVDGFILKNRSPSCGIGDVKVYDKKDAHMSMQRDGVGIFTREISHVYPGVPKEDEGRLKNFMLRESFLTKIFTLSEFREISDKNNIGDLNNFQAKHKYLFMFYNPEKQIELGQIIAGYDKTNTQKIFLEYNKKLLELFETETHIGKMVNALTHIFGYFKKTCSAKEKEFFLETIDIYREGRIPTSSVIHMLQTWALRDNCEYILNQSILEPYPKDLIELSDSGKILKL